MTYTYSHSNVVIQTSHRRGRDGLTLVEWFTLAAVGIALVLAAVSVISPTSEATLSPVKVEAGQTLWQLARAHPVEGFTTAQTVELIAEKNDLESGSLQAGTTLLVPSGTRDAAVAMR